MKTKLISAAIIVAIAFFTTNDAQAQNQAAKKANSAEITNSAATTKSNSWLSKLLKGQTTTNPLSKTQSSLIATCDMSKPVEERNCDVSNKPQTRPPVCNAPPGVACQEPCIGRDCATLDPEGDI